MKTRSFLKFIIVAFALILSGCGDDTSEILPSKAEMNAQKLKKILDDNQSTLRFSEIYEYNLSTGGWRLAADNQRWSEGETPFYVDGNYFFLNGAGSKQYPVENTPSHQMSGYYYFDLEYLVSFEMNSSKDRLFLYFKY